MNTFPLHLFEDAGFWVNIGVGDPATDDIRRTLDEFRNLAPQTVNYARVDLSKYNYEIYLVEKPFFNVPTLFIDVILEEKAGGTEMRYIRPHGHYWDELQTRFDKAVLDPIPKTEVYYPNIFVHEGSESNKKKVYPLNLYGHHHPNRPKFKLRGGTCPSRGGDWSRYPRGNAGGGWPNNYQEVTPMCDGFLIDLKVWGNLFEDSWAKQKMGLGNAGFKGQQVIDFDVPANLYGVFTDPYLVGQGKVNPHMLNLTKGDQVVKKGEPYERLVVPMDFMMDSYPIDYNPVPELIPWSTHNLSDLCPLKCEKHPVNLKFFDHAAAGGTEHNRNPNDPKFLTTISDLPLLPRFDGYIGTHGKQVVYCICVVDFISDATRHL